MPTIPALLLTKLYVYMALDIEPGAWLGAARTCIDYGMYDGRVFSTTSDEQYSLRNQKPVSLTMSVAHMGFFFASYS